MGDLYPIGTLTALQIAMAEGGSRTVGLGEARRTLEALWKLDHDVKVDTSNAAVIGRELEAAEARARARLDDARATIARVCSPTLSAKG